MCPHGPGCQDFCVKILNDTSPKGLRDASKVCRTEPNFGLIPLVQHQTPKEVSGSNLGRMRPKEIL